MNTDTYQETQKHEPPSAAQKPSDRIEETMQTSLNAAIKAIFGAIGQEPTDEEIAAFREGEGGAEPAMQIAGLSCYVAAIKVELDREAERRAAWEAKVEQSFNMVDPTAVPGLLIAP